MLESRVSHELTERVDPHFAAPDARVTVCPAAERILTVVDVKQFQPRKPNQVVELLKSARVLIFARQRVARREHMARVEAYIHAIRALRALKDRREMLEAMPERGSLTCGRFQ